MKRSGGFKPSETEALTQDESVFLRDEHNTTVLLIEHDMGMVMDISDYIVVLGHGEVIAKVALMTLKNDPKVIGQLILVAEEDDER